MDRTERIVARLHGRVVIQKANEARIEIIESFKGRPTTVKTQPGDGTSCATKFQIGEEAVFVSYLGQVGPYGRMPVSRELIENLRAYKRSSQYNHYWADTGASFPVGTVSVQASAFVAVSRLSAVEPEGADVENHSNRRITN